MLLMSDVARIGVDGLMISPLGKGLSRAELHAVEALAARGEHDLVVFVRNEHAAGLLRAVDVEVVPVRERLTIGWELYGMPQAARRHRLDAMLTLSERLPPAGGPPTIVWLFESPVHRIAQNRLSGAPLRFRASDVLTAANWRRSLRRAKHVAFGSHATEVDVLGEVPELRGRTSVVYPGLAPGFTPGDPRPEHDPYVFHLGSNDPRENTATAVEACRRADVRLVVAGGWRGDGAEAVGRVADDELVQLYRGAAAYLDPSLYEGFGYGVLEAMACGTPVVASGVTSIPEVVGDAGLLCDPQSVDEFAAALRRVLDDPRETAVLRERGIERAAHFRWERTAEGLAAAVARAFAT